jgi:hypothetical protein
MKSFSVIESKLSTYECVIMDKVVKAFVNEIKAIGESAGNLDFEADAPAPDAESVDASTPTKNILYYEKGQIDPCDDIPAFVGLSEVCKVTSGFLGITVTPLDADECFLTRPGEKLMWAANQMRTQIRATENQKQIESSEKEIAELKKRTQTRATEHQKQIESSVKEIAELKKLVHALLGKQVGVESAQAIMGSTQAIVGMQINIENTNRRVKVLEKRVSTQGKTQVASLKKMEHKIKERAGNCKSSMTRSQETSRTSSHDRRGSLKLKTKRREASKRETLRKLDAKIVAKKGNIDPNLKRKLGY